MSWLDDIASGANSLFSDPNNAALWGALGGLGTAATPIEGRAGMGAGTGLLMSLADIAKSGVQGAATGQELQKNSLANQQAQMNVDYNRQMMALAPRAGSAGGGLPGSLSGPSALSGSGYGPITPNDLMMRARLLAASPNPSDRATASQYAATAEKMIEGGMTVDANGNVVAMPGAAQAQGQLAGAKQLAEAQNSVTQTPNGPQFGISGLSGAPSGQLFGSLAPAGLSTTIAPHIQSGIANDIVSNRDPSAPGPGNQQPADLRSLAPMTPLQSNLVQAESGGNPNVVSPKGAAGMFQIMPETARNPGYGIQPLQGWDGVDPRTAPPAEQQRFSNQYFAKMQELAGGNPQLAAAAYNAGPGTLQNAMAANPGNAAGALQQMPIGTQQYSRAVAGPMQPQAPGGGQSAPNPAVQATTVPPATSALPSNGMASGGLASTPALVPSIMASDGKPVVPGAAAATFYKPDPSGTPLYNTANTTVGVSQTKEFQGADVKDNAEMAASAGNTQQLLGRLNQIATAYKTGQAGTLLAQDPEFAQKMIAAHIITDKGEIQNVAAFQTAQANLALDVMNQLKAAADAGGSSSKIYSAEVKNAMDKLGDPHLEPEAIHNILAVSQGIGQYNKDMTNGWNAIGGLGNRVANGFTLRPSDYDQQFSATHDLGDYINQAKAQIGSLKGEPAPSGARVLQEGAIIRSKSNPSQRMIVKGGQIVPYGG